MSTHRKFGERRLQRQYKGKSQENKDTSTRWNIIATLKIIIVKN